MDANKEILNFVNSNLRLEGMTLSVSEKHAIQNCLSGKTSFDKELEKILAKYKRPRQ